MCPNHRICFEKGYFSIRYIPKVGSIHNWRFTSEQDRRFVFVNYSGNDSSLSHFHGKAVALAIDDPQAPFPALFTMHETRICGPLSFVPDIPDGSPWQDWILADGVFDNVSQTFRHDRPPLNHKMM